MSINKLGNPHRVNEKPSLKGAKGKVSSIVLAMSTLFSSACGNQDPNDVGREQVTDTHFGRDSGREDTTDATDAGDSETDTSTDSETDVTSDSDTARDADTSDSNDMRDGDADTNEIDTAETPQSILRIRSISGDGVQLAEDLPEGTASIDIAEFELCAEVTEGIVGNDIEIQALNIQRVGEIGNLPTDIHSGIIDQTLVLTQDIETINLTHPEGSSLLIPNGECTEVTLSTDLPVSEGNLWTRFVMKEPSVLTPNVAIVFDNFGDDRSVGIQTIFEATDGLSFNQYGSNEDIIYVPRDNRDIEVARFDICTNPNQRGTLNGFELGVNSLSETAYYPIRFRVDKRDNVSHRYYEISGSYSDTITDGDTISFNPITPYNLDWGNCLTVHVDLPFVPRAGESFQVVTNFINADQDVTVYSPFYGDSFTYPANPIDFSTYIFVDPSESSLNQLAISMTGNYNNWREQFGLWKGSPYEECDNLETSAFEPCPAVSYELSYTLSDESSDIINLDTVNLSVLTGDLPSDQVVSFVVSYYGEMVNRITRTFPISSSGITNVKVPIYADLTGSIYRIGIEGFVDPNLYTRTGDSLTLTPPNMQFAIEGIDSDADSTVYSGIRFRYDDYENWDLDENAPINGPLLNFAYPEIWLESNTTGIPTTVSIARYNRTTPNEPIILFNGEFISRFGDSCIYNVTATHHTGKFRPPVSPPILRIGEQVSVISGWDGEAVTYDFFPCVEVSDGNPFVTSISITNPSEDAITDPTEPWNMEIVDMQAIIQGSTDPVDGGLYNPPVIVDYVSGEYVLLSDENPISGTQVSIRP